MSEDFARAAHPHPNNPHNWGPCPPGVGPAHERICSTCGARRSTTSSESVCSGRVPDMTATHAEHEYDPLK